MAILCFVEGLILGSSKVFLLRPLNFVVGRHIYNLKQLPIASEIFSTKQFAT